MAETKEALKETEIERAANQRTIRELELKQDVLEGQTTDLENLRQEREDQISRLDEEMIGMQQALLRITEDVETEQERFQSVQAQHQKDLLGTEETLRTKKEACDQSTAQLNELQEQEMARRNELQRLLTEVKDAHTAKENIHTESQSIEESISLLAEEKAQMESERLAHEEELQTKRRNLEDLNNRFTELTTLISERELEIQQISEEQLQITQHHEGRLEQKQVEISEADRRLKEGLATVKKIQADIEAHRTREKEAHEKAKQEEERLSETEKQLQGHIESRQQELNLLDTQMERSRSQAEALQNAQNARQEHLQTRFKEILNQRKSAEDELADKIKQLELVNQRLEDAGESKRKLSETEASLERTQKQLERTSERLNTAEKRERELQDQADVLEIRIEELKDVDAQLHAKNEELRKQESRTLVLQERRQQLEKAASPEAGTIHAISQDLIQHIDKVDELIQRAGHLESSRHAVEPLVQFQMHLNETLERYGVTAFELEKGHRIEASDREAILIKETKSSRSKSAPKIIETLRKGYRHVDASGAETLLRKAEVSTSHP